MLANVTWRFGGGGSVLAGAGCIGAVKAGVAAGGGESRLLPLPLTRLKSPRCLLRVCVNRDRGSVKVCGPGCVYRYRCDCRRDWMGDHVCVGGCCRNYQRRGCNDEESCSWSLRARQYGKSDSCHRGRSVR